MSSSEEMQTAAVSSSASGAGALPGTMGPARQGAGRQHNSPVQGLLGKRGARTHLCGALQLPKQMAATALLQAGSDRGHSQSKEKHIQLYTTKFKGYDQTVFFLHITQSHIV